MSVRKFLLDLFFPPKCAFCRGFLAGDDERGFCSSCEEALPFCTEADTLSPGEGYLLAVSPFYYDGLVRESIHRYKFQGLENYARPYAAVLAPCITRHLAGRYDILSWVPVSRARLRKRGYDQAKILARATAKHLDTTAVGVLKKVKHAQAQSGLGGRDERQANIAGAYRVIDPKRIMDKRILLIDDVLTTGATLSESADVLLQAGAREVLCATLARASV